jgi:hypothetical protein
MSEVMLVQQRIPAAVSTAEMLAAHLKQRGISTKLRSTRDLAATSTCSPTASALGLSSSNAL